MFANVSCVIVYIDGNSMTLLQAGAINNPGVGSKTYLHCTVSGGTRQKNCIIQSPGIQFWVTTCHPPMVITGFYTTLVLPHVCIGRSCGNS